MMRPLTYFLVIILLLAFHVQAQVSLKDSLITAPLISVNYSAQFPGGDMVNRYGWDSNVGANFMLKTKHNWFFSADYGYLFGSIIKEEHVLDALKTSNGKIINKEGLYADVRVFERGYMGALRIGHVFPFLSPNKNCGFFITAGPAFLQHKIRFDDIGNTAPQLTKEYKKGYDRLTNGPAVSAFLGYLYLDNRHFINFFGGFEFLYAWTQSRRGYNYDTMQYDTAKHIDMLSGFRVGFIIPIYKMVPDEYYTY
jgi:hypothetical protein